MNHSLNRMQFLRGQFNGESPLRPPWAVEETRFIELCERCDNCIKVCHVNIIRSGSGGYPEIDFSHSGCDFCHACAQACASGALLKNSDHAWSLKAHIKSNCLVERGVICRSCGDVCEHRAISFRMRVGGSSSIELNTAACTGCGECVSLCPVQAIEVRQVNGADQQGEVNV